MGTYANFETTFPHFKTNFMKFPISKHNQNIDLFS